MSFINPEKKHEITRDINRHELNRWVAIYRLGDTSNWRCTLCKRTDDLPHMLKHHTLIGWPCYAKWNKLLWDEEEKKHPKIKVDPNNHSLDEFKAT